MWGSVRAPPSFLVGGHTGLGHCWENKQPLPFAWGKQGAERQEKLGHSGRRVGEMRGLGLGRGAELQCMEGPAGGGESKTGKAQTHTQGYKADPALTF